MSAHTPGPWRVDRHLQMIVGPDGGPITGEANFVLAAAAPELLVALGGLLAMCERQADFHDDGDGGMFERCSAAIAKATGSSA